MSFIDAFRELITLDISAVTAQSEKEAKGMSGYYGPCRHHDCFEECNDDGWCSEHDPKEVLRRENTRLRKLVEAKDEAFRHIAIHGDHYSMNIAGKALELK